VRVAPPSTAYWRSPSPAGGGGQAAPTAGAPIKTIALGLGGYLFAFPVCGMLVGWLTERGWNGAHPVLAFAAALLGNLACLLLGAAWLAVLIGLEPAIVHGVLPFIVGGVLKSVLAAACLAGVQHWSTR
jgi:biotin transport system substrate-specific component